MTAFKFSKMHGILIKIRLAYVEWKNTHNLKVESYALSRRRQWHPTPVLLPGKSHGWRSLVGCSPWVAKSRTRLSDFTFTFHFHALEKVMAAHSSVLAWRIPGMGEPGRLPFMGSHRVRHNWSDLAAAAATAAPKSVAFGQHNLLPVVEELKSYLIFTCFKFFICEMRIITV